MEFWGVEVKPGETIKCEPGEERLLHLSQAALGETKDKGNVQIYVKFNDQKLVLGTLSVEKCGQITYDLVFEKEFELSHGSKNASVYFCGYKSDLPEEEFPGDDDISDYESEEDVEIAHDANDRPKVKAQAEKVKSNVAKESNAAAKGKAKTGAPVKAEQKAADEDDEDDDDSEDDSDFDDAGMMEALGDSDDDDNDDEDEDDESSEEEEDATPNKSAKKRTAESVSKTPVPEKKAKVVTPAGKQKIGGDEKKSGHVATPYPTKQAGKTPANIDKSKQQSPKSAGSVTCKSCSRSFNSENALQAHTKAKHSAGK